MILFYNAGLYLLGLYLLSLLLLADTSNAQLLRNLYCFASFSLSGLDPYDFDDYSNFYTNSSVMQLGEAGSYYGAEDIEEYARFSGLVPEGFFANVISVDIRPSLKTGSDPDTGDCVVTTVITSAVRTDPDTAVEEVLAITVMVKMFFRPNSLFSIAIDRANIYYPPGFLALYFGGLLATDATRTFVCNAMNDNCPDTWQLNGFDTIGDCVNGLAELPLTGENNDVSGRSQGCRFLHARFVLVNPLHCPHISVVPEIDENGLYKCQNTSAYEDPNNLFDEEDFEFFLETTGNAGVDESGYKICDCDGDDGAGFFFYLIFAPLWVFLRTLLPSLLPAPLCILCGTFGS